MSDPTAYNLARALSDVAYSNGQMAQSNRAAELIEQLIREAIQAHEENSPHIYPDGSTY